MNKVQWNMICSFANLRNGITGQWRFWVWLLIPLLWWSRTLLPYRKQLRIWMIETHFQYNCITCFQPECKQVVWRSNKVRANYIIKDHDVSPYKQMSYVWHSRKQKMCLMFKTSASLALEWAQKQVWPHESYK